MELPLNYASKFQKPKRLFSASQSLADEVYIFFHGELSFSRIMKIIQNYGKMFVRETFEELKKTKCDNPAALFLWKVKNCKILWLK